MKNNEGFDKYLENANKFYKISEYQSAINYCNSALNIEPFSEDAIILKLKSFLKYFEEKEDFEQEFKAENINRWNELKDFKVVYDRLLKIFDANGTTDSMIDKIGKSTYDKTLYFLDLLKNNDDPSDPKVIEKKEKKFTELINNKLDDIKKFGEENSMTYAYAMIHRAILKPCGAYNFDNFRVDSVPTTSFSLVGDYHLWKLNYNGVDETYIQSSSYHMYSNGDIVRNAGYTDSKIRNYSITIDESKYKNSLNNLYDLLVEKYNYYSERYKYSCKIKDKLNEFITTGGIFEKPKRRKYICNYLGIDYYTSDIYFTEVGDFMIFYELRNDDMPNSTNNNPTIEELEAYIDAYK